MLFIWGNSSNVSAQSMRELAKQAEMQAMHGPSVEVPYSEGNRAIGDNCTTPIVVNIPADLPYADLGNTTCGRGNTYSTTDLNFYDGGEDIIYQLNVTVATEVTITMDPKTTTWTGLGLFTSCPTALLGAGNFWIATGSGATPRTITRVLSPGTYFLMVDTNPAPNCIPVLDMTITQVLPPAVVTVFPFIENFEATSTTRADWRQIQESGTRAWSFAAGSSGGAITTAFEGALNARFTSASFSAERTKLITPPLDLSALATPRLSFYLGQEDWTGDQNTTKVFYRVNAAAPWIEIANYTSSIAAWTMFDLELPNPSATYQIAFEGVDNYGRANVIDLVTVYNVLTTPGLEILNPTLAMGYRPIGAWMEPARFEIVNNPGEGALSITAADIDNNYGGFVNVVAPALPFTLASGATTTAFGLTTNVEATAVAGPFTGQYAVIFGANRALATATYDGTAYVPIAGDVVENAFTLDPSPLPAPAPLPITSSRENAGWYKNYILPNDLGNSPTENDIVWEIAPTVDMLLNISAFLGSPVNMAIYAEDFEGEGGPMATNAMVQAIDNLVDVELFAGNTYYLVGSSLLNWDATYTLLPMPAPDPVTYVAPLDGAININNASSLRWTFGNNVSEYEVVLGTTYPPTTVVVPYTSTLATSYTLAGLQPNMQYFWRVNVRNTQGVTAGPVWGFTTTIDVPLGLTVTLVDPAPTANTVSANINWTGPSDRAFIGYNLYRNGSKVNTTPITESQYTDLGLARNTTYAYRVSNVFDEGESALSAAVTVTTKGVGIFNGFVYDFLTNDPIEGARVDIAGPEGNYSVLTAANGAYSTQAYRGTYSITASATDYTSQTIGNVVLGHGLTVSSIFYLMEAPYPVGEVIAFELNDNSVQVSWSGITPLELVKITQNPGAPSNAYYQSFGMGYGVVYDLTDYPDASINSMNFYHASWGLNGTWPYKVHVYNWDTKALIGTYGPFNTTGNDKWETGVNLGNISAGGADLVAIIMEPLGNTANDAYPSFSSDNVANPQGSIFGSLSNPAGMIPSGIGNFLMELYVYTAQGTREAAPRIVDLGKAINAPNRTNTFNKVSKSVIEQSALSITKGEASLTHRTVAGPSFAEGTRGIASYDVWRQKVYQPGSLEKIGNTISEDFVDFDWGIQDWGVYRWAVTVNYDANQVSAPTFSNTLDKDMNTVVDVTVTLNSADSPAGTLVTFTNTSEPGLELVYDETLGGTGMFTWDMFRRGVYDIEVFKAGYTSVSLADVNIFDETSFEWLLDEILAPPTGLYVTPTGYATWESGSSAPFAPFMENFDGGIPSSWTIVDGGTSTDTWYMETPAGNPQSSGASIDGTPFAYVDSDEAGSGKTLDEILVSPVLDASNAATLYLEFDQYYNYLSGAEYSKVDVFNGTDWVNVLNQTADAGSWTAPNHQVIDVTAYINDAFQVRFHYFDNAGWKWYWAIDNVELNEVVTRGGDRSLVNFKVFHDGVLVAEVPDREYQYGTNGEVLVDGETYLAEVAAVYSTGQSTRAAYTWTYIACDNYATPGNFAAAQVEGALDVNLTWTVPAIPVGEDQIDFARIYRDGIAIAETDAAMYLDEDLDIGTYEYCITFVYESGAETCPGTICKTAIVTGGGFVSGNVKQAAYLGGANIQGAAITLTSGSNTFTFTTNASGNYSGEVLGNKTYNYTVEAAGYITQTLTGVEILMTETEVRDFLMMEFPAPVEMVVAEEISDNQVKVSWRSPGTNLYEPFMEDFSNGLSAWTSSATNWGISTTANAGGTSPELRFNWSPSGVGDFTIISPAVPLANTNNALYLSFKHSVNDFAGGYTLKVITVADGVTHVVQEFNPTGSIAANTFSTVITDAHGLNAADFKIGFMFSGDSFDINYWYIDDISLTNTRAVNTLRDIPESTLAGYNVYRTSCEAGGDLQFLGYTLDSIYNDNTWATAESGTYKWAVEAVYAENESEIRFSNCLDKDMITNVSVTVITNSNDSPEGTDVMLTNTSEPELGLVYDVELDATGYFMWEEFRKGTYDVYVEKNGFAPIMETVEVDGPTNLSYILEELLAPVSDLHVSPTGFATWRAGGIVPFEATSFDFEADAQGWDIQGNVNGWQWGNNASLSSSFMTFNGNSTNFIAVNADAAGSGGSPIVAMAKSPVMNLENADEVYLSFDYTLRTDAISVHYSIAEGAPVLIETLPVNVGSWINHVVMLPEDALAADVQIIFLYTESGTWSYGGGVDNVVLTDEAPDNRVLETYKVWLDGIFVTDTPNTYYQYDPATLTPGQEYYSEVAALYSNGMSAKMDYTWTYYPCDSFPGPASLTYEVVDVNDVVLNWSGNTPPPPGGEFFEGFEAGNLPTGWVVYDVDGDGFKWDNSAVEFDVFDAHTGLYCMTSASYRNDVGALTPNNWLVTPAIAATATSQLKFWVDGQDPSWAAEKYYVKVSTTGNAVADFTTTLHTAVATGNWQEIVVDLAAYAGQTIYIAFQHTEVTDMFFIKIDDVTVTNTATRAAHTSPLAAGVSHAVSFKTQGMSQSEIDARINHTGAYAFVNVVETAVTGGPVVNVAGESKPLSSNRAILYDNGPLVNSPGTGPGGADESILQSTTLGMNTLGAGSQFALGNHMADDFVVDANWTVDDFTIYTYQTGSTTTSTITGGYLQIYNGNPSTGGTVIWGDMVTNRMTSTSWSNIYRLSEGTPGTTRPIMKVVCSTPGLTLTSGTYWVEFTFDGSLASGPWAPPITITGQATTGNGLQNIAGVWGDFLDSGTSTPQGLPFLISGTVGGGGGGGSTTFDPGEFLGANVYRDGELIAEMVQAETYTDMDVEPGYYDYCVTFVYADNAMSCLSTCVLDVLVTEDCEVPQNLTATGVEQNNEVTLVWNENVTQEFRYDDGISTGQLGSSGGTLNTVLGAKYTTSAELTEMSWYTTAEGGPHTTIQIYVFGLTSAGLPNGNDVLYTASVTNTDATWNTHTFPTPITADGGFLIGIAYNGFAAIGTDDGVGAPYVFQTNTHYFVGDYTAGGWETWETYQFNFNGMIRAIGVAGAKASYAVAPAVAPVEGTKDRMSMVYTSNKPVATGAPQWSTPARDMNRAFLGYNIYRDGSLLEALWPETTYVYLEGAAGITCYTVTAEYEFCGETEPSNEACVDFETGVNPTNLSEIKVYPNPSNSKVFITLTNDVSQVVMYNYLGQVVMERNITDENSLEVDVRNYEAGAYLVKFVTSEGKSLTKKVVVTK